MLYNPTIQENVISCAKVFRLLEKEKLSEVRHGQLPFLSLVLSLVTVSLLGPRT